MDETCLSGDGYRYITGGGEGVGVILLDQDGITYASSHCQFWHYGLANIPLGLQIIDTYVPTSHRHEIT
jgi:hypothetical protein